MPAALTRETLPDFTRRIEALSADSQRKFGKMSIEQMLKHLRNAHEVAIGDKQMVDESNPLIRGVLFFAIARVFTTWPADGSKRRTTGARRRTSILRASAKDCSRR